VLIVRTGLLFLILVAAPVQVFAINSDGELTTAIQNCTKLLVAEDLDNPGAVNSFCPQLRDKLHNSFLGAVTFDGRFADLTYRELLDIQKLLAARLEPVPTRISFSYTNLDQILSDTLVVGANAKKLSWWDKFLAWLEEKLRTQDSTDLKWLEDILKALTFSEETRKFILYGSFAIIILLALAIVGNELKAGGIFRCRTRAKRSVDASVSTSTSNMSKALLTPESVQKLPQQMQPQALLNLCINHLIRSEKLPDDRSRTNREFLRLFGNTNNQNLAQSFRDLVERAERSLYGGEQLSSEALSECFERSRRLLGTAVTA